MDRKRLVRIMDRYGAAGILFVGAYLGVRHLWRHRHFQLVFTGGCILLLLLWHGQPASRPHHVSVSPAPTAVTPLPPVPLFPPEQPVPPKNTLHYDRWETKLPYRASWGPYTVVVDNVKDKSGDWDIEERVRILNQNGRTLREVHGHHTDIDLVELTGKGLPELHLRDWSGGAYASFTDLYFTQEGGLRNILIFDGDDLGVKAAKDLDGDGIPEIIAESPVLGDFSGYEFHRHHPIVTILGWKGTKYVDVTRKFPDRSLEKAEEFRKGVPTRRDTTYEEHWTDKDVVAAYYLTMLTIGRGAEAKQWLEANLTVKFLPWLRKYDRELRKLGRTAAGWHAITSQKKVILLHGTVHGEPISSH